MIYGIARDRTEAHVYDHVTIVTGSGHKPWRPHPRLARPHQIIADFDTPSDDDTDNQLFNGIARYVCIASSLGLALLSLVYSANIQLFDLPVP